MWALNVMKAMMHHITSALNDRPGAAPAWDNVIYNATPGHSGLGYVDAMHQSLQPVSGATVLTHYRGLGLLWRAGAHPLRACHGDSSAPS
jgi:hypothetical protein